MGFWQGLNEGISEVMAQKERKRELEARRQEALEEREFRTREAAAERAARRQDFMLQLQESRRDNLLTVFAQREQEKAEAAALRGKAQSFFDRLGDVDDPRVAALAEDPRTAAELEDKLREIEKARAENDLDLPPLQGEILLDLLVVQNPDTGRVGAVDLTLDDLLEMDMSDRSAYEQTALALATPQPRVDATLSAEAYRRVDPKRLEEGRDFFNQEVLRLANERLAALETNAVDADGNKMPVPEADEIRAMLEGFSTEGSAERFALMDMFGSQAFANLAATDNPYIQNLEQDPQLSRYSTQYQLQVIVNDPEASEEDRARAQELLNRLGAG